MNTVKLFSAALAAVLFHLGGVTMAAPISGDEPAPVVGVAPYMGPGTPMDPAAQMQYMGRGRMMAGGMMGMMGGCPMMGPLWEPNARVVMQMHGEMMRAMGEIMMKYADKLEVTPAPK